MQTIGVDRLWAVERLSSENLSPLKVVFILGKNNYERWEKNQKWSFYPTAQSRFKPGQKQLWAVSNVCRSNDQIFKLGVLKYLLSMQLFQSE